MQTVALPRISVIIPTLNEAKNLPILLPRLPTWIHDLVIIDGRSVDNTVEVARALRPDTKIVMCTTRGKGAALRAGFEEAEGEIIVMMDADGSMDPGQIITFVAALMAGADFVKGSRFLQGGGTDDMSLIRQFGNWCLTQLVRTMYGGSFTDLCYGYIAFWSRHLPVFENTANGFEIETLLNVRAMKAQLNIVEVASFEYNRIHGESNLRAVPDGLRVLRTILTERLRSDSPASSIGQA
ncbi:MAG: glycosyltransferase family 2 protein [Hyphomicrobiaceae bacterium]